MQFLVIERFRGGDPRPVYARLAARGRQLPAGVAVLGSWVTEDGGSCYQVMEAAGRQALDAWIAAWADLVDFEVLTVVPGGEAARLYGPTDSP